MRNFVKIFFAVFAIVVLGSGFYALTLRGIKGNPGISDISLLKEPTQAFELSHERSPYVEILSLVQNGSYALPEEFAALLFPDIGYHQGKFYSYFPPGLAYMALPLYKIGKEFNVAQLATFALAPLASIISLVFLFKISRNVFKLPIWTSMSAAFLFAFGTTAWSYAVTLYQHHLTVLLMLSGFYAVWKYKQGRRFSWIWGLAVWTNYGLAILIDYSNALIFLPIMFYFLIVSFKIRSDILDPKPKVNVNFRPAIIYTIVAFALVSGWHAHHNEVNFGSWKKLSGGLISYRDYDLVSQAQATGSVQAAGSIEQAVRHMESKKKVVRFFAEEKIPQGLYVLLVSPERGMFFFAPLMFLGVVGMYLAMSGKSNLAKFYQESAKKTGLEQLDLPDSDYLKLEHFILLFSILVILFLYSSWGDPWGGWAFGPRYMIPAMAILSLYVGVFMTSFKNWLIPKLLVFAAFLYSAAVALLGALTTNSVPPKIEAIPLNAKFTFMRNLDFLKQGQSGSFFFNNFAAGKISLAKYFLIIYVSVVLVVLFLIFILPLFNRRVIKKQ